MIDIEAAPISKKRKRWLHCTFKQWNSPRLFHASEKTRHFVTNHAKSHKVMVVRTTQLRILGVYEESFLLDSAETLCTRRGV
jgi:hypothetical protein